MVLGTASHVGKSIVSAALCRILHQDGFRVAPFKAQNMALNSFATRDGHEIGRAQAVQAQAAGVEPHVDMNPILLKPSMGAGSQVILDGKVFGNITADNFQSIKPKLLSAAVAAYERVAARYELIILEGAGSPVEMNLKDGDIANLKMAQVADAACLLVADIDRGGVFASLVGTYELLRPEERARFGGFIINKFRGDIGQFQPGADFLEGRLRQRCLGVIPYLPDLIIDEEDSVSLCDAAGGDGDADPSPGSLRVCVIRLPHISNFSDFEPLKSAPGVTTYYARTPRESRAADVLIIPGSKNTIADLLWLRATAWDVALMEHMRAEKPVIGICGGFQMLGMEVHDPHHMEGDMGEVRGLGLLDVTTSLGREKVTRQARATVIRPELLGQKNPGPSFEGYEIHLGETNLGPSASPFLSLTRLGAETPIDDGAISKDGHVIGTYLHGLFDSPEGSSALLGHLRRVSKKFWAPSECMAGFDRQRHYDKLATHFRRHLEMKEIYRLICAQ